MARRALIVRAFALGFGLAAACSGGGSDPTPAPKTPQPDAFVWTGNTRLFAGGLLVNDPPGSVITAADTTSAAGGAVFLTLATGAFTYDPPLGLQNAVDTFRYTVAGFAPVTVTVDLRERVWWVKNVPAAASPDGSDRAPFATLAAAEAASDAGDTIFVFAGNVANPSDAGQDLGIALKPGQRLIGEGVGLRVQGVPLVDPFPKARISNRGLAPGTQAPVVLLATGNEVAGFEIDAAFNEGVLAVGGTGHDVHDNAIAVDPVGGVDGIRLLAVTGKNVVARNAITGATRDGVRIANDEDLARAPALPTPVAAAVTLSGNVVSGSAHDGISARLDGDGTDVTLNFLTNVVTTSGTAAGHPGIDVSALGAAHVSAVVSRNIVDVSAGEGVRLSAAATSRHRAFVANNALSGSGAPTDFLAVTEPGAAAAACLELLNNRNLGTTLSRFAVENGGGTFQLFEGANAIANDTPIDRQGIGDFVDVASGACAVLLDGAALFEANCGKCHTGNGRGGTGTVVIRDVTGASAALIALQLLVNGTMNVIRLTDPEIQAIAGALAP